MRYKENLRQNLDQVDNLLMRLTYQIGRNIPLETVEETLQAVKEKLADSKALLELEEDGWKPRF